MLAAAALFGLSLSGHYRPIVARRMKIAAAVCLVAQLVFIVVAIVAAET